MSGDDVTVVWVELEPTAESDLDVDALRAGFVAAAAGAPVAEAPIFAAQFGAAGEAVEAAIVGQWAAQRLEHDPGAKTRVGVHTAVDPAVAAQGAAALARLANGNQIVMSNAVDQATGGMLDARPLGLVDVAELGAPQQVWLSTDSRPDIDRRPLRLDHP